MPAKLPLNNSREILINNNHSGNDWNHSNLIDSENNYSFIRYNQAGIKRPKLYLWGLEWTNSVLKYQVISICILTWLLVVLYGSYLPIKTTLNSELVPLWSLWIIAMYTLSLCIGFSFHYYPSLFGIGTSAILQLMALAFSSYFELIGLSAMDEHGRMDKNEITRIWGALLYSTILAANGAVNITSFILIVTSLRDLCGAASAGGKRMNL